MKTNLIYTITLLLLLSSCKELVEDLNNDPNNFQNTSLNLILGSAALNIASIAESDIARYATMFSDQFMGVDRQYGTVNGYSVTQASFDRHWESLFLMGATQAQIAKQKAINANATIEEGISLILEGYYFAEAALLFGDIPFSQVNKLKEYPDPIYEPQKSVIEGAIELIKDGITKASDSPIKISALSSNSSWKNIGNALLARYYLNIKEYDLANQAAKDANFSSNKNDLVINHSTDNFGENLFWQFEVEQRGGYLKVAAPKTDTEPANFSYMLEMLDINHPNYKGNTKTTENIRYNYYADGEKLNTKPEGFAGKSASFPVISANISVTGDPGALYRTSEFGCTDIDPLAEGWEV